MATAGGTVLAEDFYKAADFLSGGGDLTLPSFTSSCSFDTAVFRGALGARRLSCGLRLAATDATALCDSVHEAEVPRSLFIGFAVDGQPGDYTFDSGRSLPVVSGGAVKVAAVDTMSISGRYRKGQDFKSLLIQADPSALQDEHLADKVESLLVATAWERLHLPPRALSLTNELCFYNSGDCVSALLLESCALELLARGLTLASTQLVEERCPITRKDRERMSLVRDALTAAPELPHHLSDLARHAGVSVTSLKAKFPAVFGQPVFAFLRDIRLERARKGLEEDGWTVSQAAHYSGYRHPSNFSTAFQRKFRVTPREVKRRWPLA